MFFRLRYLTQDPPARRDILLFHDFCAFVSNADDGGAGLSPRLLSNVRKYLFQPLNLAFSFAAMLFERGREAVALRLLPGSGAASSLLAIHEKAYLEHCRLYALNESY